MKKYAVTVSVFAMLSGIVAVGMMLGASAALGGDVYSVTADGQTFDAYFEDYDGQSWMLIGRGRKNWEFDTDGQGSVDDVSQNLKVQAGFAPACYSDAIVNDLLSQAGMAFPGDVEVRIMRATTVDGMGTYQDSRWTNLGGGAFTFDFDGGSGISVTHAIMNAGDTPVNDDGFTTADTNTRDNHGQGGAGDTGARIFTWGHQSVFGFRYGSQISGDTADGSFLYGSWPAAYTEVYIPYEAPAQGDISFKDFAASNVTATAAWPYATASTNLTGLWLVWDTSDKGDTNLLTWTGNSGDMGAQSVGEVTGNATNLTADTLCFYRFYGEDSAVPTNGWSKAKTFATALTAAQAPAFTSTTSSFDSVTLEWDDNAATETGYVLQRSTNDVDYAVVATLDADTTTHVDGGLLSETTYYYQLAASNDINGSATAFASCATNVTTDFMPPVTTYTGPAGRYDRDTWNTAANWSAGIPSASQSAVIEAGRYASVTKQVSGVDTPAYTGDLTLEADADLEIGSGSVATDYNVLGTPGTSTIFMYPGSFMTIRAGGSPIFPAVQLEGDAGLNVGTSTNPSSDPRFDHGISGPYTLSFWGKAGCDVYLTASNNFSALTTGYDPWTSGGFNIWAQATNSLPQTVTMDVNAGGANTALLIIDSDDAMPDTGALTLNGNSATKLTMNADDTIGSLNVNGFPFPTGTHGRVSTPATVDYEWSWIAGDGVLTVTSAPSDSTPPTVDITDDSVNGEIFFSESSVTYTFTFNEAVTSSVTTADFENIGSAPVTIDSVTQTDLNVIQVVVTASDTGTLKLRVKASGSFADLFGNALSGPITDDVTIDVREMDLTTDFGILDLTENGGINPATGDLWQGGDTYRFIFASSTGMVATSTNIADYNAFVQTLADASPKNIGAAQGATWKAIASTATMAANVNTATDSGTGESIWLVNGTTLVADDYADLYGSQTHSSAINKSETGGSPYDGGDYTSVWTGSDGAGNIKANDELGDDDGTSHTGLWGATSGAHWIDRFSVDQTRIKGLYGLSMPLTVYGSPAAITNNVAVNVGETSADLTGTLKGPDVEFVVSVYWSTSNNADSVDWLLDGTASNAVVGTYSNVLRQAVTGSVSLLNSDTTYHYTMVASNAERVIWATPNASFITASAPAVDTAGGATGLGVGVATLNGELTAGGSADAYICWGESDGGTNSTGSWQHVIPMGVVDQGVVFSNTVSGVYYGIEYDYRVYVTNVAGDAWSGAETFAPLPPESGAELPVTSNLVAHYDAGVGVSSDGTGVLTWEDQSGNDYHATRASGSPTLVGDALNERPEIQCRNRNSFFNVNHNIFVKEQYVVGRAATPKWNNYGAYFANKSGRAGSYLFENNNTGFHGNQSPSEVSRDGVVKSIGGSGTLVPMQDYMVLKIVVNEGNTTPRQYYVGRSDHSVADLDVLEIIGYGTTLSDGEEDQIGGYLAYKYGISTAYPTYEPPAAIGIASTAAENIGETTADLVGTLDATQSVFEVTVFWSTSNNVDAAAWLADGTASSALIGTYTNVTGQSVSHSVGSLANGATYYYTMRASNDATNLWASPNATFITASAPVVDNAGGATDVFGFTAILNGELTAGGVADAYICWGTNDMGTTSTGDWDNVVPIGEVAEAVPFSTGISGLMPLTTYYYSCYVTNAVAGAWSGVTNFTTLDPNNIMTGTTGGNNSWNDGGNWTLGHAPIGMENAIVSNGIAAQVYDDSTPEYSGTLTLQENATLHTGGGNSQNVPNSLNVLGTNMITMHAGSVITLNMKNSVTFPALVLSGNARINSTSNESHHRTHTLPSVDGGTNTLTLQLPGNNGLFKIAGNNRTPTLASDWSGGLVVASGGNDGIEADATGSLGTGDVTLPTGVSLRIDAVDAMGDGATLSLNGAGSTKAGFGGEKLAMNADDTVSNLWINGYQCPAGAYDSSRTWISGSGTLTVLAPTDTDAPTVDSIVDDVSGGPIPEATVSLGYTVNFNEFSMDGGTVDASDFSNAGTASVTIGDVAQASSNSFTLVVYPHSAGSLQLQINAGAEIKDMAGLALDTTSAIQDDTTITIEPYSPPPAPARIPVVFDGFVSWDFNAGNGTYDASGSDKLVVVVSGEHNFNQSAGGQVNGVTYDGQPLTKAVDVDPVKYSEGGHGDTATDIWYLDNPGDFHTAGTIAVSVNGRNYVYTAMGLSDTAEGVGDTVAGPGVYSTKLAVSNDNSMVIFNIGMGGSGNTASPLPGVTATSPTGAVTIAAFEIGSNWAGHAVARKEITDAGVYTFSFDTTKDDVATIAAEFPGALVPPPDGMLILVR